MSRTSTIVASTSVLGLAIAGLSVTSSQATDVALTTGGLTNGYLVLDLGADGLDNSRWALYEPGQSTPSGEQGISGQGGCSYIAADEPEYAVASAGDVGEVGLRDSRVGVASQNGGGQNCAEVSDEEALTVQLGTSLAEREIRSVELDLEVTGDCLVQRTWLKPDGTAIGSPVEDDLTVTTDCGPNSTGSDNYRRYYEAPTGATGFTIEAGDNTTVSLMGGLEPTDNIQSSSRVGGPQTTGSVIELGYEIDGTLDCPDEPNQGVSSDTEDGATVTRIDDGGADGGCKLIEYALEFVDNELLFAKDLTQQPNAEFTITATYTDANVAYPGPTREIDYFDGQGFNTMVWCEGDASEAKYQLPGDQVDSDGGEGNPAFFEPDGTIIDGWCIAKEYVETNGTVSGDPVLSSVLTFYGKGDPRMR
jgi:hypothetical protein